MATVIQPSVWDLWWKIAIYHDNVKLSTTGRKHVAEKIQRTRN